MRVLFLKTRVLFLSIGLCACAKTSTEVSFVQQLTPTEGYSELKRLAFSIDPYLDPELRESMIAGLKTCTAFQEITVLEKPVKVSGTNPKDYLDAFIKTSEVAQNAQGILSLQIEANTQSSNTEKVQLWSFEEKPTIEWGGAASAPFLGTLGLGDMPEPNPQRRYKRRETLVRSEKTQFVVRLVVYNKLKGAVIHDRLLSSQSSLYNYSRKAGIKKNTFLKTVEKSLVKEAMFHACPSRDTVTRKLYYGKDPADPSTPAINEGIELAMDDRWTLAAAKWTNVLIKAPKQPFALHNLGVHFERQGELLKALGQYREASMSRQATMLDSIVYDEILRNYQPPLGSQPLYPQVAFVNGDGWIYIRAESIKIPKKRTFSVYRIDAALTPDQLHSQGLNLREIGVIRLQSAFNGYYTGRMRDQLVDFPVRAGDFLIVD